MSDKERNSAPFARRDAETMMMLGGFMAILALPVLVGTAWADTAFAKGVNALSGLVLLGIGGGMLWRGLSRIKKL